MTKLFKITIGIILVIIILILVFMNGYLTHMQKRMTDELTFYASRKEDLMLQQQKLITTITQLNSTLESEKTKYNQLPSTVPVVQTVPAVVPPSAPVQQPPTRVTRAS